MSLRFGLLILASLCAAAPQKRVTNDTSADSPPPTAAPEDASLLAAYQPVWLPADFENPDVEASAQEDCPAFNRDQGGKLCQWDKYGVEEFAKNWLKTNQNKITDDYSWLYWMNQQYHQVKGTWECHWTLECNFEPDIGPNPTDDEIRVYLIFSAAEHWIKYMKGVQAVLSEAYNQFTNEAAPQSIYKIIGQFSYSDQYKAWNYKVDGWTPPPMNMALIKDTIIFEIGLIPDPSGFIGRTVSFALKEALWTRQGVASVTDKSAERVKLGFTKTVDDTKQGLFDSFTTFKTNQTFALQMLTKGYWIPPATEANQQLWSSPKVRLVKYVSTNLVGFRREAFNQFPSLDNHECLANNWVPSSVNLDLIIEFTSTLKKLIA
jgi:hypothetical protein